MSNEDNFVSIFIYILMFGSLISVIGGVLLYLLLKHKNRVFGATITRLSRGESISCIDACIVWCFCLNAHQHYANVPLDELDVELSVSPHVFDDSKRDDEIWNAIVQKKSAPINKIEPKILTAAVPVKNVFALSEKVLESSLGARPLMLDEDGL